MLNHPVLSADCTRELVGCRTTCQVVTQGEHYANRRKYALQILYRNFTGAPCLVGVRFGSVLTVQVLKSAFLGNPQSHIDVLQVLERLQQRVTARRGERIQNDEHLWLVSAGVQKTVHRSRLFRSTATQTVH